MLQRLAPFMLPAQNANQRPVTATFQPPAGYDINGARIVWEANGLEPAYGTTFTFTPTSNGAQWSKLKRNAGWPACVCCQRSTAVNSLPTVTVRCH